MRAKHLVPNGVTLANISLGFLAIVAAAEGQFDRAVLLLFVAALCDALDGRLARMLDATSRFGQELDSLSDAVSFGVAPAVIIYLAVLRPLGLLGAAAAVAYLLCGVIRLARFGVDTSEIGKRTFVGCPIPVAAGYILSFVLVRHALPAWAVAGGTLWIAGCMVSTIKVPKFRRGEGLPFPMMLLGIGLFMVFLARPSAITWHVWNGWNCVMILGNYVSLARDGHLRRRVAQDVELKRAA